MIKRHGAAYRIGHGAGDGIRHGAGHGSILLLLILSFQPAALGQIPDINDLTVTTVYEECGKWMINFNWSDVDEYDSSVAHGDSTTGKASVKTDSLTLASSFDRSKALKVSVIMYYRSDPSQVNMSSMADLANNTLERSDVCQEINLTQRSIEGRTGIFANGQKCSTGQPVYAAVYPVEYHLDRPGGILDSDAIGLILSTYDREVTERFLDSVKIEQIK